MFGSDCGGAISERDGDKQSGVLAPQIALRVIENKRVTHQLHNWTGEISPNPNPNGPWTAEKRRPLQSEGPAVPRRGVDCRSWRKVNRKAGDQGDGLRKTQRRDIAEHASARTDSVGGESDQAWSVQECRSRRSRKELAWDLAELGTV